MELDDVEIFSLHPSEALLDALENVVPGEDVSVALPRRGLCRADQTAALAGEVVLGAPGRDVAADALFAQPIVDRGVDVVDPGVEHGVQNNFRLRFGDVAAARRPTQLHCPVAQHRDRQPGASEFSLWYRHADPPSSSFPVDLSPTVDTS